MNRADAMKLYDTLSSAWVQIYYICKELGEDTPDYNKLQKMSNEINSMQCALHEYELSENQQEVFV